MPKQFCCAMVLILAGSFLPNLVNAEPTLAEQFSEGVLTFTDPTFDQADLGGTPGGVFELRLDRPRGCDCPITVRYRVDQNEVELIIHTNAATFSGPIMPATATLLPPDALLTVSVPFTPSSTIHRQVALAN